MIRQVARRKRRKRVKDEQAKMMASAISRLCASMITSGLVGPIAGLAAGMDVISVPPGFLAAAMFASF